MAGHSSVMLGVSWTDLSVLGSQLFGQALAESCEYAFHTKTFWKEKPVRSSSCT